MKRLSFAMLLSVIAIFSFVACEEEEHNYPVVDNTVTPVTPKDISNVTAEAGPRSVILRWETPAESNISYVEVVYTHPRTNEVVTCKGGAFNDSIEISGLIPAYGEITFNLCSVSKTGNKGSVLTAKGTAGALPLIEAMTEKELPLTAANIQCNNIEPSEGSVAAMFDGNLDSFFHSKWSDGGAEWRANTCWFVVDLKGEYETLDWRFTNRSNGNGVPKVVDVYGSMDGENWDFMKTIDDTGAPQKGGATTTVRGLKYEGEDAGKTYKYLKLWIREPQNGSQTYICLAEFRLITLEKVAVDPNDDDWNRVPEPEENVTE